MRTTGIWESRGSSRLALGAVAIFLVSCTGKDTPQAVRTDEWRATNAMVHERLARRALEEGRLSAATASAREAVQSNRK